MYQSFQLNDIDFIRTPIIKQNSTHSFYVYPIVYDYKKTGIDRDLIVEALKAEGVPISGGYVNPLYLEPLYQNKIAYGEKGCPFTCKYYDKEVDYSKGLCENAESLHEKELLLFPICSYNFSESDIEIIGKAFIKVFNNIYELNKNE